MVLGVMMDQENEGMAPLFEDRIREKGTTTQHTACCAGAIIMAQMKYFGTIQKGDDHVTK